MRVLLDTNVLLWTLAGHSRIAPVRDLILDDATEVFVSTASLWEIAIKAGLGKLDADVVEVRGALADSGFQELPVLGEHTEYLQRLAPIHRDPFDRLLVAQAMAEPMRLLTGDATLQGYSELVQLI